LDDQATRFDRSTAERIQGPFDLGSSEARAFVHLFMAENTQSDQILHIIVPGRTPKTDLMNLQFTRAAAILTSPAIPI
jgi:hypothetical protein